MRTFLILKKKIFVFFVVLFSTFSFVYATNIAVVPDTGSYSVGKTFIVDFYVTNNSQAINAVSGVLSYPVEMLQVQSLSKSGSIIKLWAEEPAFSNSEGSVKFDGVILNPGFSGSKGKILSITFLVKKAGNAPISFSSGSVLANDGEATNIIDHLNGGAYSLQSEIVEKKVEVIEEKPKAEEKKAEEKKIEPIDITPKIVSKTNPDSDAWYKSKEVDFTWEIPEGVTAVRTLYGENPDSLPSKLYDPPITGRNFTVDKDGVYYIHVQFKNKSGWGKVSHYKFQIDSTAPTHLKLSLPNGNESYDPRPLISIDTKDELSGIDHATIKINNNPSEVVKVEDFSNYRIPTLAAGPKTASVAVFDKAGNTITQSIDFSVVAIDPPIVNDYTKKGEQGDVFKVIGKTYPNSVVDVVYMNSDGVRSAESVKSDADGNFTMLWTKKLDYGAYELKVRVNDSRGAISEYTPAKAVLVEKKTYVQIGIFIVNWLTLVLLVLISAISIVMTLWYGFVQFKRFRKKVHRTIQEAEATLKTNVQALRRDTEEFHDILQKAEKKRALTKEENMILRKFKKRIEITEKEIEQKLEQIG